ncbi:MAG: hypothetical protein WBO67_02830, partial [Nitrospira sp.]
PCASSQPFTRSASAAAIGSTFPTQEPVRHGLRSGAKEARPDASPKKPDAYSLEYVEDYFGPRTTQMIVDRLPQ